MNIKFIVPLVGFLLLVGLMVIGLNNANKKEILPSPFIGQPAPEFSLPKLYKQEEKIAAEDMKGKVWVMNIWASWCPSCRAEHQVLTRLIDKMDVPTIGLNYKDYGTEQYGDDAIAWLKRYGNPYHSIAVDTSGSVGLDWGVFSSSYY